jgi:hypothetical protein
VFGNKRVNAGGDYNEDGKQSTIAHAHRCFIFEVYLVANKGVTRALASALWLTFVTNQMNIAVDAACYDGL